MSVNLCVNESLARVLRERYPLGEREQSVSFYLSLFLCEHKFLNER